MACETEQQALDDAEAALSLKEIILGFLNDQVGVCEADVAGLEIEVTDAAQALLDCQNP